MKQLFIILAFLSSCAELHLGCVESPDCVDVTEEYDSSRSAVIYAWEQLVDTISEDCQKWVEKTHIAEVEDLVNPAKKEIRGVLHTYRDDDGLQETIIFIGAAQTVEQKDRTVVHELIHVLATCESSNGDSDHSDPKLWTRHGPNTVESIGCQDL
jgi:hypothetical protein